MTATLVTVISYLCTLVGLGATAAYAVTFYMLPYNEIYLTGQSGYDEQDLPYTYAIVECAVSGSTFIIGILAFTLVKNRRPSRNVLLTAIVFFSMSLILAGTFGVLRAWNMGYFGDEMERTCSDSDVTGCPTTRWEDLNNRDIMFTEPKGGQCTFWYWGPKMGVRYDTGVVSPCVWYGANTPLPSIVRPNSVIEVGTCTDAIETYMDWSKATSYGWRDDPSKIVAAMNIQDITTIDKVHNMKILHGLQGAIRGIDGDNKTIPAQDAFSVQPSIAYCWYWGCSATCQPERHRANHWWLFSSAALFLIHLLNIMMSISLWQQAPKDVPIVQAYTIEEGSAFEVPEMGRRRRRLVKNINPTGLMF